MSRVNSPHEFTSLPFVNRLQQRFPVSQLDGLLLIDYEIIQIKGGWTRNDQFKHGKYWLKRCFRFSGFACIFPQTLDTYSAFEFSTSPHNLQTHHPVTAAKEACCLSCIIDREIKILSLHKTIQRNLSFHRY